MPIDAILKFEAGELSRNEIIDLFQGLVNSGLAWQLQGCYGRMAAQLIDQGLVVAPSELRARIKRMRTDVRGGRP